ncbi:hypothetical protein J6500_05370 [Bradyrhizobium sp. WSM 1704]|uniref:hypothetical protein n=1 Tax=Bradyrhizobium semiaridum TaxID=2821404 RepID=UPI001CE38CF4|nr:hypothetical protein [Bradyrhizobium semiaridum]MCA6121334.1 hypothetical protein [Bradyrhizobium semiaridum]
MKKPQSVSSRQWRLIDSPEYKDPEQIDVSGVECAEKGLTRSRLELRYYDRALNESRPLFRFSGIRAEYKGDRRIKSSPIGGA